MPPTGDLACRHVPWLGIKLVTLWFAGRHSIHWATPARDWLRQLLNPWHWPRFMWKLLGYMWSFSDHFNVVWSWNKYSGWHFIHSSLSFRSLEDFSILPSCPLLRARWKHGNRFLNRDGGHYRLAMWYFEIVTFERNIWNKVFLWFKNSDFTCFKYLFCPQLVWENRAVS